MDGFYLLIGHLIGDYIVQNDWMASRKSGVPVSAEQEARIATTHGDPRFQVISQVAFENSCAAHLTCFAHCICYTLAVWACCFWWINPLWMLVVFGTHFPIDRWRLARWWMINASGQEQFATGLLSPWSIIIVDNVFHLIVLAAISLIAC